jgi:hypothetical protein
LSNAAPQPPTSRLEPQASDPWTTDAPAAQSPSLGEASPRSLRCLPCPYELRGPSPTSGLARRELLSYGLLASLHHSIKMTLCGLNLVSTAFSVLAQKKLAGCRAQRAGQFSAAPKTHPTIYLWARTLRTAGCGTRVCGEWRSVIDTFRSVVLEVGGC